MGDEDRGGTVFHVNALQLDRQFFAGQRIQCGKRLVHQHHTRLLNQRSAQGDALLHSA
jgi:hypothetical protein